MFFILHCVHELPGNLVKTEVTQAWDGARDCIPRKFPENADTGPQRTLVLRPGGEVVFIAYSDSPRREIPVKRMPYRGLPSNEKHNIL